MKRPNDRHEEVTWTAARCNRLLRTITSRLGILRKLARHAPQVENAVRCISLQDTASFFLNPAHPAGLIVTDSLPGTSPRAKDPDWVPQSRKRQCERTYAGNAKRRKVKTDHEDGRLTHEFRTPFIRRVLVSTSMQSTIESPLAVSFEQCSQAIRNERKSRALSTIPTTSADQAYRTLLPAFEAILVATKPRAAPSRLGSGSLMKTCLRRMPAYIDLEQSYADAAPEAQSCDVTSDTYEFLESLGSRIGGGWRGLKCVVRAHAVALIQGAIADSILPDDALDALLAVCSRHGATEESRSVLRSWFESRDDVTKIILDKFVARCITYGHRSLLLQSCGDLISRNHKLLRFCSQQPALWCEVVKAFVSSATRAVASSFCEAYIMACVQQPSDVEPMVETIRTSHTHDANVLLTAYAWKQCRTQPRDEIAQHLYRWTLHASLDVKAAANTAKCLIEPFLLSSLVLQVIGCHASSDLQRLDDQNLLTMIDGQQRPDRTVQALSDFIYQVATNISYAENVDAHCFMKTAGAGLLEMADRCNRDCASISRAVATHSAKAWTDHWNDAESYGLLEEVEYAVWCSEVRDATSSPARAQKPIKYRWEDGLCEWIARTPKAPDSSTVLDNDSSLDSVHDSGVDFEFESLEEEMSPELRVPRPLGAVANDDQDDEDELALITPIRQQQRGGRVHFDLGQQGCCNAKKRSKPLRPNQVRMDFDDTSDDELAIG